MDEGNTRVWGASRRSMNRRARRRGRANLRESDSLGRWRRERGEPMPDDRKPPIPGGINRQDCGPYYSYDEVVAIVAEEDFEGDIEAARYWVDRALEDWKIESFVLH